MLKNSLIYFVLFNLLQFLLVEINCIKPSQRSLHTTTFIDNKLYVLGGRFSADNTVTSLGRGFFYLDFSVPFTTQSPSWEDISSKNFIPQHTGAAAVIGGKKNDTLFLYGGETTYERMAAVYTYTPSSNAWGIPNVDGSDGNDVNVNGINLYRKALLTGIGDNGNMYLWGGQLGKGSFVNDMLILDTRNLKWIIGSLVNSPTPRSNYGATLLPNNKIIYMGGSNGLNIGLDEVYIYDTVNDSWDTKKTSGKIPSNRQGFSANLGLDGNRVIIFGGLGIDSTDALYVLSLDDFKWNIPKISGNLPTSRHQRYEHKSDVIKNYMVITFGRGYNPDESDILLLDISNNANYVWTTNFDPSGSSTVPKKSQNYKLIGIVAASVISTMLLTVGSFYLYKWNKNRKNRKAISPTSVVLDKSVVLTMVNDNNDNSQESKQIKK